MAAKRTTQGTGNAREAYDPMAVSRINQTIAARRGQRFVAGQCPMHRGCDAPENYPHRAPTTWRYKA